MKKQLYIALILCGMLSLPATTFAQEAESADISLEGHSDAFQEHFFDALKESAVENYEKAINLLTECKTLEPENAVIDYELGKNHTALKRYAQAERHLKNAVEKDPGNLWYLDALFNLYKMQNNELEAVRLGEQLAQKHYRYKENLAQLYARYQNYKEAIRLLDELDQTLGASTQRKQQRIRYTMLMNVKDNVEKPVAKEDQEKQDNPLDAIQARIDGYQNAPDYNGLLVYINEVLETYPSQSKFYYIKGKTLNRLEKHAEAVAALETALDFLVDDPALEDTIYRELVAAYKALGKTEKVREYSKKIKSKP